MTPARPAREDWVKIDRRTGDAECNHGYKWRLPPAARAYQIRRYDERQARKAILNVWLRAMGQPEVP